MIIENASPAGKHFCFHTNTFVYVPIQRLPIEDFLQAAASTLLLDVRSPGEYEHAQMPGAVSLPLFSNEERKVVGTAYKQESREKAIKIGLDYFGPKMRPMVEQVEAWLKSGNQDSPSATANTLCVYCWRGGMRSGAVAWLLGLYGFKVLALQGGYKRYRNWVLQKVSEAYPLKLIGGFTGSGKTYLLHELRARGQHVIDLEALANHKGSAFGSIGLGPQPSQEQFENALATALAAHANHPNFFKTPCALWVEDESQRIGNVNIPGGFWQQMRSAPVLFVDIPFEERLQHLVQEYGHLNLLRMREAIERIAKRLGPLETKSALASLDDGNIAACFRILLLYYDKHYRKALHNRQNLNTLLCTVACSHVSPGNASQLITPTQV